MRILGIDPGLQHTGWAVIDAVDNRLNHIANGTIHTRASDPMAQRLAVLDHGLQDVLLSHHPEQAAVEETFVNKNGATTLLLGQARGVALLTPARAGLPVAEYAANLVKKSIVGAGHAAKDQVALMVKTLMPGIELDSADSTDAVAVAICHAHHAMSHEKISEVLS